MTTVWDLVIYEGYEAPEHRSLHLTAEGAKNADMGPTWMRRVGRPPDWKWVENSWEPGHWWDGVGDLDAEVIPRELLP